MEFLIKALQLIMSLSILVVLHELGHFIPAKLFKTRIEKFYLFFDPWFSVVKKKVGDTEYGIGWLPLGGYVKIFGETEKKEVDGESSIELTDEEKAVSFFSKTLSQRTAIVAAGPLVNFVFAIFAFAILLIIMP